MVQRSYPHGNAKTRRPFIVFGLVACALLLAVFFYVMVFGAGLPGESVGFVRNAPLKVKPKLDRADYDARMFALANLGPISTSTASTTPRL